MPNKEPLFFLSSFSVSSIRHFELRHFIFSTFRWFDILTFRHFVQLTTRRFIFSKFRHIFFSTFCWFDISAFDILPNHLKTLFVHVSAEGKQLAASRDVKFIETSSGIQHNVDELLVGILKQVGSITSTRTFTQFPFRPRRSGWRRRARRSSRRRRWKTHARTRRSTWPRRSSRRFASASSTSRSRKAARIFTFSKGCFCNTHSSARQGER